MILKYEQCQIAYNLIKNTDDTYSSQELKSKFKLVKTKQKTDNKIINSVEKLKKIVMIVKLGIASFKLLPAIVISWLSLANQSGAVRKHHTPSSNQGSQG